MHLLHFFTGDDYTAWQYHLCDSLYGLDNPGYTQSIIMHPGRKLQARLERMGVAPHILSRNMRKPDFLKQRALGKWLTTLKGDFALLYGAESAKLFASALKRLQMPGLCLLQPDETQPPLPGTITALHYTHGEETAQSIRPPVWAQTAGEPVERKEMATPPRTPVLGIYGRLRDPAPVYPVLDTLAALHEHHLWIGGEGPAIAALHSYSRTLGIEPRIHYCGETIERDTFLKSITSLLVPPGDAGVPSLIPQAWVHGTPVICALDPASSPVINGENGLQLAGNSAETWQNAIIQITGNDDALVKDLIKGGLSAYTANYRPEAFAEKLQNHLNR